MIERKPLNVNACNLEEVRGVIREAETQIAAVVDEQYRLRVDFDALVAQLGHLGARPT